MAKRLTLDLELPDDLLAQLKEGELASKAKQALVMEFLREHLISQGKAAELLGLDRHGLLDLMSRHHVPVIDFTAEELKRELDRPVPRS